jgi:tetratricopeptide (TPR) repeat protein
VSRWRGDHATMRECSNRAAKLLPEGTSTWLLAKVSEAFAAASLGENTPAEALATLLALLLEGGDVSGPAVWAAARTCNLLVQRHIATPVVHRLITSISNVMAKCKDARAVGMVYVALSQESANRQALEDAVDFANAAVASFTSAGDVRYAVNTRMNAAYILTSLGQWKRAREEFEEGIVSAERAGMPTTVAMAKHNLGLVLLRCGDAQAGEPLEREAIAAYEAQNEPRLASASRLYLGLILIGLGRNEEAEAEMRRAVEIGAKAPAVQPLMMSGVVFALLARGKNAEALEMAQRANAIAAERGWHVDEPSTIKLGLAQSLVACGKSQEASGLLSAMSVELLEQASHLRDPELRRSFLHDVTEHARVFALQKGLAQTE